MEYRETAIVRIMLLTGLDRTAAERRIEAYTSGRIGRRELYAPPGEVPPPAQEPVEPEAPAVKRLPKSRPRARPRRDVPAPRPYRSTGPATINLDALGDDVRFLIASPTWPTCFYERDALQSATMRMAKFVKMMLAASKQ